MRGSNTWSTGLSLSLFASLVLSAVAAAQVVPGSSSIRDRSFRHPDLYVPEATRSVGELDSALAAVLRERAGSLGVSPDSAFFDPRTGRVNSVILRHPLIPGTGRSNRLTWSGGRAPSGDTELGEAAWSALREYLRAHQSELRIDLAELQDPPRVGVFEKGAIIFIHIPRLVDGIPVRDNSIGAAINHGNLILLGLQKWGDVNVSRVPGIDVQAARASVAAHVGASAAVSFPRQPHLELVPMANGEGLEYRLAWVVAAKVDGDVGNWEGLVDAQNGTLFAFQDRNQYGQGLITGGAYPISNDQRPPDGVEQPDTPMPFVDYTVDGVKHYADTGGNIGCIPGSISTALAGLYLQILDTCGAVNETGTGFIDLGSGPTPTATDCTTPGSGHSAGDTKASRSGYYELNRQAELARGHLTGLGDPAAIWVRQQLTANMNLNQTCNAFWDGGAVNFFRSGGGCRNTGEIAAIFDHEWGHGLDNNGVNPNIANPGESIADIYAMLRLNLSCMGRGFFQNGTCGGYGDECIGTPSDGCTGVRDMDYAQHRCDQPHTISWIQSGFTSAQCGGTGSAGACPGGDGPCGKEVHCEGMVAGEAAWDLQTRDLTAAPFNYDARTAHEVVTRLYYIGNQPITSLYTCAVGGGCNATGQYMSLLAADDDDGDISNGTPHMTAIRAAYERHEIHCATPAAVNSGCAGGPTAAPDVTLTGGDRRVDIAWTAVPNATAYRVYRSEGVNACQMGKVIVAETADLTFRDEGLANGRTYSYGVIAVGAAAACFGPMSECASVAPVPGPSVAFSTSVTVSGGDGDPFLDNCETATISFAVSNDGNVPLTNVRIVSVTPVTHPLSTIETPLPAPIAASLATCASADTGFQVTAQGLTYDGESDFLVEVAADEFGGETRSQLVRTLHTESDLETVATRTFSFETDREGWVTVSGTFNRILGAGANGTVVHMSSSSQLDNACDVVRSPLIQLTGTSTLQMYVRYDIEPPSGGQWWDRANVSLVDSASGDRTVVVPSGGRLYDVPNGAGNGTCSTSGQRGWDGTTPGFPNGFYSSTWTASALNAGGAFTGKLAYLQVNYGTDGALSGKGFDFDEVTITNFSQQVPDAHSDDCSLAVLLAPSSLSVDAAGNGVLEPGEVASVKPTWSNTGVNSAAGVTGAASGFGGPAGPTYTLTDATAAYGTLNPGAAAECSDCYGVQIAAAGRPAAHWDATVSETVSPSATAKTWTLHVGNSFATDTPPSHPFYKFVETIFHNGITAGCDVNQFCPESDVSRAQMAVFLLTASQPPGYTPPTAVGIFSDVPVGSFAADWIEDLYDRGITGGCDVAPLKFCPGDPVTRAQMAVFLTVAGKGSGYTPPTAVGIFGDVPVGSFAADFIEDIYNRGITGGCSVSPLLYCPDSSNTRGQMAVFLTQAFELLLYGL